MAAFNAANFIEIAIASVLDQTYQIWELIIINDGSKDATREIVGEFSDPRIMYLEQSNKGVSAARNVGLEHATGDFICFLDADDILPPKSIEVRLKAFVANPIVDFVDGSIEICNSELSEVLQVRRMSYTGKALPALLKLDSTCFFGNTWMIKRTKNYEISFLEGMTHGEDLLYYIEHARNGGYYMAVEDVVLKYRRSAITAMTNLDGLSRGYQQLYSKVSEMDEVSQLQKAILNVKIKKIMTLSYLNNRQYLKALKSLVLLP